MPPRQYGRCCPSKTARRKRDEDEIETILRIYNKITKRALVTRESERRKHDDATRVLVVMLSRGNIFDDRLLGTACLSRRRPIPFRPFPKAEYISSTRTPGVFIYYQTLAGGNVEK